jgi:peptidoglycan hydrolase-like protein with peptidoglycan-binding domain
MLKQVALVLALSFGCGAVAALAQETMKKPEKFETGVLELSAQDVERVQSALVKRGYALRSAGEARDRELKDVVGKFQKDLGLKSTGKLDLPTLHALGFDAVVAVSPDVKGADLAWGGPSVSERPAGLPQGANVMSRGSQSLGVILLGQEELAAIQERLKDEGYFSGSTNGTFSKDFVDAVRRFQQANRIKEPGGGGLLDLATLVWFPEARIKVKVPRKAEEGGGK